MIAERAVEEASVLGQRIYARALQAAARAEWERHQAELQAAAEQRRERDEARERVRDTSLAILAAILETPEVAEAEPWYRDEKAIYPSVQLPDGWILDAAERGATLVHECVECGARDPDCVVRFPAASPALAHSGLAYIGAKMRDTGTCPTCRERQRDRELEERELLLPRGGSAAEAW